MSGRNPQPKNRNLRREDLGATARFERSFRRSQRPQGILDLDMNLWRKENNARQAPTTSKAPPSDATA